MVSKAPVYDAIVVGGGFYGAIIATYLAQRRGMKAVLLVEQENTLMLRASYNNQARVHNGYHYPRSFTTAYRSRINLPRFVQDWPTAVFSDFTKLYAIARRNSKVTSAQFVRFCKDIGAEIQPASSELTQLFETRLIEGVFEVKEFAFNSKRLAELARADLDASGVQVLLNTKAHEIAQAADGSLSVSLIRDGKNPLLVNSRLVFNCTYSGLNQIGGDFRGTRTGLKHEITEMALMRMPPALKDIGVTVMDGPFFSFMPFPSESMHTVSHVRYTPHLSWLDEPGVNPYSKLDGYPRATRVDRMIRDICRYMPTIQNATYEKSLFEVKTILLKNEGDDGRPILFESDPTLHGLFSVLGGKIDNIYDVLERLESLALDIRPSEKACMT